MHMGDTEIAAPETDAAERMRVIQEIVAGLTGTQKTLPAKLFYDAEGCALFGRITDLPEYYVTRAEMALLGRHAGEIAAEAPDGAALVEYGASDETKGTMLLDGGAFAAYVPIDIAPAALAALSERLRASRPVLPVHAVAADFLMPLRLPDAVAAMPRFGFFPGSTIGNFRPDTVQRFLRGVRDTLGGAEARFVVGIDLRKDPSVLVPAYDDAQGVTAAFNRNILSHVNRLAAGSFLPERFRHLAVWNGRDGRIEMHLEAVEAHEVEVAGRSVRFRRGETIHTEDSYKHTREGFAALAASAGWRSGGFWSDPNGLFGMHLLLG